MKEDNTRELTDCLYEYSYNNYLILTLLAEKVNDKAKGIEDANLKKDYEEIKKGLTIMAVSSLSCGLLGKRIERKRELNKLEINCLISLKF